MAGKRKVHTAAFKAQVALAALKADPTTRPWFVGSNRLGNPGDGE